jgi:Family of unknown function (DUF5681)
MSDDLTPHTSGYTKPPKSKRFKKGKSGNPKGGPKTIDNPSTIITKVLARRVTVAGSGQRVTMLEALTYKLRELTLSGDPQALKLASAILKVATKDQPGPFEQACMAGDDSSRNISRGIWEKMGLEYPEFLAERDKANGYE